MKDSNGCGVVILLGVGIVVILVSVYSALQLSDVKETSPLRFVGAVIAFVLIVGLVQFFSNEN